MRVLLAGLGVTGSRAARQLASMASISELVLDGRDSAHVRRVAMSMGERVSELGNRTWESVAPDVVVIALPAGMHQSAAVRALTVGAHVVSCADSLDDVDGLLDLDRFARSLDRSVLVGAGFSPGLSCILARHASAELAVVDEIHVAKLGTGGPACARQHHKALRTESRDFRDGRWIDNHGGSGRELVFFPEPIGGADCYRGGLPESVLLQKAFPTATRLSARMSATRRDRLTSRLPMMRKPHPEAGAGGIRVEVRGRRGGVSEVVVMGAMDRPSVAAGAVLAVSVGMLIAGQVSRVGSGGLAEMVEPVSFLKELALVGVKCARFEGTALR